MERRVDYYAELGATVHLDGLPESAAAELDGLYENLLCTADWFRTRLRTVPEGAVILDGPRHVLPFKLTGDTVRLMVSAFTIAPADVERACRALFRAFPRVHRVQLDAVLPPGRLGLPVRKVETVDHMVVDIPSGADAYRESLGKSTRKNLRLYEHRLRTEYPDARTEVLNPGDRAAELVERLVSWKMDRFKELGRTTYWQMEPRMAADFVDLLGRRGGEAHVTTAGGSEAAISFVFSVGSSVYALETAFDPAFARCHLGFLAQYWVVCAAAEHGAARVHLMQGTPTYKQRLGATPRTSTKVSVFRRQTSRIRSLAEAMQVASRTHPRIAEQYDGAHRSLVRTATTAKRRARTLLPPR